MGKSLERHFTKEEKQVPISTLKSLNIISFRDMQIKTMIRYHITPTRSTDMEKVPQWTLVKVWAAGTLLVACQMVSWRHGQLL